ncbi:hypothetical protein [Sphingomonas sp. SRS2]|uniref:hypothetical protein n=1 Tax=Sphingomonas sp. SRS2 TaxID=133190 RepID=UPI0006184F61|nr:hypothetical protein [Sphingomonas sp. SRS2]KKC27482.1 hypothetical protein WP12_03045 [Sphingomonas sp. SRS2]
MAVDFYRRIRVRLFWGLTAFAYVAAIMPGEDAPDFRAGDKTNHIIAFLVLTLVGRTAYRRKPAWLLASGLSLFGIVIELTQAIPVFQRDASVWDWLADSSAILVALGIAILTEKRFPRPFAT